MRYPALLACLAASGAVWAQTAGQSDRTETIFIAQIVVLLGAGRLCGELIQRIGLPQVMGQLLAGVVLGPSLLGLAFPGVEHALFPTDPAQRKMIGAVGELGIILMLLVTGMQMDLSMVRRIHRAALAASLAGIVIPFACGYALGYFLPESLLSAAHNRRVTSLFLGTALSIASVKVVSAVVKQMNFTRRNVGQVILASAIIDDTLGWIIIAITFGIASHGSVELRSVAFLGMGTALFLIASFTVGRRAVSALIRWANDLLHSEFAVVTTILIITGVMSLITDSIGIRTVLGAIVAGMLIGQSPILTRHIEEQLRGLVEALFMPVFFALSGLSTDLTILREPRLAMLTAAFVAVASIGKFTGAFVGGRIGGLKLAEAIALGCGMNARGATEVIVASIGLSMGAVSGSLYTMIVTMAVATTLAMPPSLRWSLRRIPMSAEERSRLEREEFESRGFLNNLERLLVAVDDSPNGRFASRIAGLLGASRQILTTVLSVAGRAGKDDLQAVQGTVEAASARASSELGREGTQRPRMLQSASGPAGESARQVIERESRKGHDFLIVGLERIVDHRGWFDDNVVRAVEAFAGAHAIIAARAEHLRSPLDSGLRILVPVTGNDYSQRGAEVAFGVARAAQAPLTLLYISTRASATSSDRPARESALAAQERATLRSMVRLAEQHGVRAHPKVAVHRIPAAAILAGARTEACNLIVLGVNRRAGETLFFGTTAAQVLTSAEGSVMLVAT